MRLGGLVGLDMCMVGKFVLLLRVGTVVGGPSRPSSESYSAKHA